MPTPSRLLFLLADGARADVLEDLARKGHLANVQRLFSVGEEPVRRAATTLPSATGPAYLPFLTGRLAGPLNVPGIRWFDRFAYARRERFAAKRSYVGLGNRFYDRDLDPSVRTLFHYEPDHVNVFNPIDRGVRPGRNRASASRPLLSPLAKYFGAWRLLDGNVRKATRRAVDEGARLIFSTFMGIDENSHDHGVRHPKTLEAYKFLDESLGEMTTALERRGELEKTRIVLTSDHGLSDTRGHFPLAEHVEEHGYRPIYYPRIWRRKPRAAVMVSGNALAHLYLSKRDNWSFRPRGALLWAEHGELLQSLARNPQIDLLAYRDDDGQIVVQRGEHRTRFRHADGRVKFETVGENPLGVPAEMRVLDEAYYFSLSWSHDYPDAVVQLGQLLESPRAGDVVILARPGHDLRARFEIPHHRASHGSLHRDHLLVPLLINDSALSTAPCRTVDVFVYILRQLGHAVPPDLDGRDLPWIETEQAPSPQPAPATPVVSGAPHDPPPEAPPVAVPRGGPPD